MEAFTSKMERLTRPFQKEGDTSEQVRQLAFIIPNMFIHCAVPAFLLAMWFVFPIFGFDPGNWELKWQIAIGTNICALLVGVYLWVHLYKFGISSGFIVFWIIFVFCWLTFLDIIAKDWNLFGYFVLLVDLCFVMQSGRGSWAALDRMPLLICVCGSVYQLLHALSVAEWGVNIHVFDPFGQYVEASQLLFSSVVPLVANSFLVSMYATSARNEARLTQKSVDLASRVAASLVNFDLTEAEELLAQQDNESPVHKSLTQLLHNLRAYRPFLPSYLFFSEAEDAEPPNEGLKEAMEGQSTSQEHAKRATQRIREPGYTLGDFRDDVTAAFPELSLYNEGGFRRDSKISKTTSGLTTSEEYERTMGALFSTYCLARLDMDGRELFSYGVDAAWRPLAEPRGEVAEAAKRQAFCQSDIWDGMTQLMIRADLLRKGPSGALTVNIDRMTAFIVLTAVHDIMKNAVLLPTVQKKTAPFKGYAAGEVICDHDAALAYVMECFPSLLPSYNALEPGQRATILFTQSRINFNNGWLVQGEAPAGALLSTFKRVIVNGGASEADVSFYFAHWVTDLAGAVPYGDMPWPGSAKFAVQFPQRVLSSFLESFAFVDRLASMSEVDVMEAYLQSRWSALGLCSCAVAEGCRPAARRLALMAQGFEAEVVRALHALPPADRDLIALELARTGHAQQFDGAPPALLGAPAGPALLVYYAPALVQKAGAAQARGALQVLAAVYRAARALFPCSSLAGAAEGCVTIRIDALKVLSPREICEAARLHEWHLRQTSDAGAEAARGPPCGEAEGRAARIGPFGIHAE